MTDLGSVFALGTKWETDGEGHWISAAFRRLAEIVNDYDPSLWVVWIKPEDRNGSETHPYGIMQERGPIQKIIFTLTEEEMNYPERVMARVQAGDIRLDPFTRMRKEREWAAIIAQKAKEEAEAEQKDIAKHVLKSPKHEYRHNGRVYR